MTFIYDDGGRAAAGYRGTTGDCTCRAIAIATGKPYQEVYDGLNAFAKFERRGKRSRRGKSSARTGVKKSTIHKYMASIGWVWVPTMFIGSGCQVHLKADELPPGRLVVAVSRHMTTMIDGVIRDTYDCSREGTRCVYGYYRAPLFEPEVGPWDSAAAIGGCNGCSNRTGSVRTVRFDQTVMRVCQWCATALIAKLSHSGGNR